MLLETQPITPRVVGALALLLLGVTFAAAAPEKEGRATRTFWEKHGKVEEAGKAATSSLDYVRPEGPVEQLPLTLENLRIPIQHGSLKKVYAAREPIIIHIQDAHANYEAQKHLAGILEHMILHYGLSLVLVEGGSRNDSLSYMREYAPLEKRRQVAEEFLMSGKISGENYLDLTSDYDFTVYGIERPELYDENMEAFFNVEKIQAKALIAIRAFRKGVETLKERLYPAEVKTLELEEQEVKDGRIPLAKHYEALAGRAKQRRVTVEKREFPNLIRFLKASRLERELNFKAVESERTRFLESLTRSLPKREMDQLLKQSLELKQGLITPASFYGHLSTYLRPEQTGEFPILAQYIQYLTLFDGIAHASLFTEVETLSDRVKETHFTNASQRTLAQVAKDVGVLNDLLELKLTPDSYEYYRSHKRQFRPDRWSRELNALGERQRPKLSFPLNPRPLNAAIPSMSSFYEVARERDKAMVKNALEQIEAFEVPFAVLIAGGFHTPAFERLFREQKVSYVIVAPKVGKVTEADTEKYHRVLKETYVPMSDKYRQKLNIPPVPGPRAAEDKTTQAASATAREMRPISFPETAGFALVTKE